jgi:peptide/nickel transport system substrate-binding protein
VRTEQEAHVRQGRFGVLILAMALVAAACGEGDDDDDQGAGQGTTTPARQELTVGVPADQYLVSGPRANLGYDRNIAEPLLLLTPAYEVRPHLAERYEFRAPNTWRFFLRRGVTFHDGQPFNAQAVKVGLFDRMARTPLGGTIRAGETSAVVVDEFTIDFTPTELNLRVPEQIVHPTNVVVAPGTDMTSRPIGTGPFRFAEYVPRERLVVERNPSYWGPSPKLSKITFRFLPDDNTRRLALESGELDLIQNVPTGDVRNLQARGFEVAKSGVGAYDALYLSVRGNPPFDQLSDIRLRQAVAGAIDTRAIVDGVLDGQATTDKTMVPPAVLGPHASLVRGLPFDVNRARSLLDQAGYQPGPDGIRARGDRRLRLRLACCFPSPAGIKPIPEFIQTQLRNVGIELEIVERPDSASYQSLVTNRETDIAIEQGNQNDANPAFLPLLLFHNAAGSSADYVGLYGPGGRFDEIMATTLTETDMDKVKRTTAEGMRIMIDEQAIVVPLAGIPRLYGMKRSVQGFLAHPATIHTRWDTISLQ